MCWVVMKRQQGILGVPKKLSFDNFQHYQDYIEWKFFYDENKRQRTISEQIMKTFGQCQNLTFEYPYQLY